MKQKERLLERLKEYDRTDFYPFHMPGHKRNPWFSGEYGSPFSIDITEIHGFDNLHNPEGILKASMEWAAKIYGADKTYYLINGSSSGILSAVCAAVSCGGKLLLSRNCHKSAFHGVFLNHLSACYVYPQIIDKLGIQGGILPSDVERLLEEEPDIQAVLIVSPTYDGIVSDIRKIAETVHKKNIPLIVDEAHGAHFPFGDGFPVSAYDLGADVVIQSVHKTLPCFTQTAVLHVKKGYMDVEKLEYFLRIFQSSSPSYLFMSGIENCIYHMDREGREWMIRFAKDLEKMRQRLSAMKKLKLAGKELVGNYGIYDVDPSKFVIITRDTSINGVKLDQILRETYHLEMEMASADYVVAITSVCDTKEGLDRLTKALLEIDKELEKEEQQKKEWQKKKKREQLFDTGSRPKVKMTVFEAITGEKEQISVEESAWRTAGEFVYVYPPGIPIIVPGETILPSHARMIRQYQNMGLSVQGLKDLDGEKIQVMKNKNGYHRGKSEI